MLLSGHAVVTGRGSIASGSVVRLVYGARFMVDVMGARVRQPLWGALESNTASLRLGGRLGFTPVGDLAVFSRGGWVFLSGGFTGA
jgi:hypothetical protein